MSKKNSENLNGLDLRLVFEAFYLKKTLTKGQEFEEKERRKGIHTS
jgi:hypothetical protein